MSKITYRLKDINGVWLVVRRDKSDYQVVDIIGYSRNEENARRIAEEQKLNYYFYTVDFVLDLEEIDRCRLPKAHDTVVVETLKEGEWKPFVVERIEEGSKNG